MVISTILTNDVMGAWYIHKTAQNLTTVDFVAISLVNYEGICQITSCFSCMYSVTC